MQKVVFRFSLAEGENELKKLKASEKRDSHISRKGRSTRHQKGRMK